MEQNDVGSRLCALITERERVHRESVITDQQLDDGRVSTTKVLSPAKEIGLKSATT